MSIQTLILLGVQASIFLKVLTLGMDTSTTDLRYLFSKSSRLFRSLLAMLLAVFVSPVAVIPYTKWRKRLLLSSPSTLVRHS